MKPKIYYDEIEKTWYRVCRVCKGKSYHKNKKSCQVAYRITPSCAKCQPLISKCSICGNHGHNKSFHNPIQTEKICKRCKKSLSINEFFHQKNGTNGKIYYGTNCKKCDGIRLQKRYNTMEGRIMCLFNSIKRRCQTENIPFGTSYEYLVKQYKNQDGLCYFTKEPFVLEERGKLAVSIDRIIPEKGYIDGNIVFCLFRVNEMKSNVKYEEFIDFCKKIYENRRCT